MWLGIEPGAAGGGHRRIHWAMAAHLSKCFDWEIHYEQAQRSTRQNIYLMFDWEFFNYS